MRNESSASRRGQADVVDPVPGHKRGSTHMGSGSRRRVDWRQSNSASSQRLRRALIVVLLAGFVGVVVSVLGAQTGVEWAPQLSVGALWFVLLSASIYALVSAPARSLFAFRSSDLLWGVGLAVLLRLGGGLLAGANTLPFPTIPLEGMLDWVTMVVLPQGFLGPVVEEIYFRAVLTVVVYRLLRPLGRPLLAGLSAVFASAGCFVLLHCAFAPLPAADAVMLLTLSVTCSSLVLMTGRIWGAVLTHIFYNVSYVALAAVGFLLA
ncbi:CPBP family intramembrane glutamic endopeptidase [Microbacterium sp. BH-3-3-3]|uniref:CPBP family intramembrane glutamic endopeptidase n=1 Tax=Microbacterium sp. BH-3-3-3 TaxID=1906742 RepID=UPI0011A20AA5|nr:CPBP family intramembrane glutamic endopeptidase [Microbacterium sp. BH-3-3-3]